MSQIDTLLTRIALDHLFVDTLKTRKPNQLNFHKISVWNIKSALEAAFKAGVEVGAALKCEDD